MVTSKPAERVIVTVETSEKKTVYTVLDYDGVRTIRDYDGFVETGGCATVELKFHPASTTITPKAQLGETWITPQNVVYIKVSSAEDAWRAIGKLACNSELLWCPEMDTGIGSLPRDAKRWPACSS